MVGGPPSHGRQGPHAFGCSSWPSRWLQEQGKGCRGASSAPSTRCGITQRPPVPGACPKLAHPSSLTIVELSSWPQGAHPEIGCLVSCKDKGAWNILGPPHPRSYPHPLSYLGRRLAGGRGERACLRICLLAYGPEAQLTTGHSLHLEVTSTHPLGPCAGTASLILSSRSPAPGRGGAGPAQVPI